MARPEKQLTARTVETTKKPGLHSDGAGLYLHVSKSGAKSWIFRWREPLSTTAADNNRRRAALVNAAGGGPKAKKEQGRLREMGLGPINTISLAEARDKALACRKLKYEGGDPIAERRARRQAAKLESAKAMTFTDCAKAYIATHQAGWRNPKHAAQWPATLAAYVNPVFGDLPVAAVDVALVMRAIEPIWNAKPETASRVRGRIESVLDWAKARGYRQGENPARWRGHLENLLPKKSKVRRVEHHAALPYPEIAGFITELRRQEGIAARALGFAILTSARTSEVRCARWAEIDLEGRLWTIPAERMKAGREHRVPLSEAALSLLRRAAETRQSEFVFAGAKPTRALSQMAMLMLLRRMGHNGITVHGFRSAFADWCAEQTNFPSEVREMALAHAVGDRVEAAYRRGDLFQKRRLLAEAWGQFCNGLIADDSNVVALDRARA
jgi:integrase